MSPKYEYEPPSKQHLETMLKSIQDTEMSQLSAVFKNIKFYSIIRGNSCEKIENNIISAIIYFLRSDKHFFHFLSERNID